MAILPANAKSVLLRFAALPLGLLAMHCVPIFGQQETEPFWVAGRYDGESTHENRRDG